MNIETLRRKANQQWELAGLARQDGDHKAEQEHTAKAREYDARIRELRGNGGDQ